MMSKLLFVAGFGTGYVLGSRAGRERYEQIRSAAQSFWSDPKVRRGVDRVGDAVADHTPDVPSLIGDGVTKLTRKLLTGSSKSTGRGSRRDRAMQPTTPAPADTP